MTELQPNRRLSAILAADIVGYSRLMASDEAGTLAAVNRHREALFDPNIAHYNGRIVKLMGDGTLVEFFSAMDAVQCARDIQLAIAAEGGTDILLRMGINLGDVILQDDDIFGNGVNVASRLEQLSEPGGICVSSVVHEIVGDRLKMAFRNGGEVQVKNIDRPLQVFHWHPEEGETRATAAISRAGSAQSNAPRAIAVLPFDNMSGDPEQEYFSDGITEDIITDLSKVSGLSVIARNSSFAYKGKPVDLRIIGRDLGVAYVLEGSVRRAGERVRITAQLIGAADGTHLWADRYDRDLTDIFAVQDEVTLEIVNALKIKLSPAERANIAAVGTANIDAHEDFMRMRGFLFFPGMNAEGWRKAVFYGERAVERDPDYADALAMLALMHLLDYHNQWSGRSSEAAMREAEHLSSRAFALQSGAIWPGHAHAVLLRWRGRLDEAEVMMKRLLETNAEYSLGLFTMGEILLGQGKLSESVEYLEGAIRLDPSFRHQYLQFLAMAHFLQRNFETAVLLLNERVFLVPDTDIGRGWLASALGHVGEFDEARRVWADLMDINPDFSMPTRLKRLTLADPRHVDLVMEGLKKAELG